MRFFTRPPVWGVRGIPAEHREAPPRAPERGSGLRCGYAGAEKLFVTTPTISERAAPGLAGRVRTTPASWLYLAAGAAAIAVYFALYAHPDAQSIFYVAIGAASVVTILVGAAVNLPRGARLAWSLFAVGL